MSLDQRDAAYLWDMVRAARSIQRFMDGIAYETFMKDEMRSLAVERAFEIIGEAARKLSVGFRDGLPDLPWRGIIGLRNVIAHNYGEIDYESRTT